MFQHRIATLAAVAALMALTSGCETAMTGAVASLTESDVSRAPMPSDLSGTWRGWFRQAGIDGHVEGDMMLEIKDDGTYRLISTRRGRGDVGGATGNDSGVVAANGRSVTLKSSSGQWISLMRSGDALHGVTKHRSTGYTLLINVEKASGAAGLPTAPSPQREGGADGQMNPTPLYAP